VEQKGLEWSLERNKERNKGVSAEWHLLKHENATKSSSVRAELVEA
jgi:hypothetical protein